MKKIAIVLAAGKGERLGSEIPKQFIEINNKPIFIYTLERLERSNEIDDIYIVSSKEWFKYIFEKCNLFKITKFKNVIEGGNTGLESVWNGFNYIEGRCSDEDIIIIQDGNRPLTSEEIIKNGIAVCEKFDMSVSVIPQTVVCYVQEQDKQRWIDRNNMYEVHRPEFFKVSKLLEIQKKWKKSNCVNLTPANIMLELGENINPCKGSAENIKITFKEDIKIFQAILNIRDEKI